MPSADQVPVKSPHSRMQWHMWVVLIAGSTGSALRAVPFPTFTSRKVFGAISLDPQCGRIVVPRARSHHCPGHSRELVGQRDGREFGRPSGQQRCEPGPMLAAVDLGITDDSEGASHEQAAQIAVTLFADTAEPVPTSA